MLARTLYSDNEFSVRTGVRTGVQFTMYLTEGASKQIKYFTGTKDYPAVIDGTSYGMSYINDKTIKLLNLTNKKYKLKKPITITIDILAEDEYLASFEDAGIAFSATTATEAIQELELEIIAVYKLYKSEKKLGPWPKQQLAVLEDYIGERT